MTLSPGDKIQIILTVGGVPYAKTCRLDSGYEISSVYCDDVRSLGLLADKMAKELARDIYTFADEKEEGS